MEVEEPIKTADEPVVVQLKQAPVMAIQTHGRRGGTRRRWSPRRRPQELVADAAPAQVAAVLPQTASSLPLIALFGLLALGGAWALRLVQKRIL